MAVADFQSIYAAWRQCRRRKGATPQAQRYELSLLDRLTTTVQALEEGRWQPAPPVCFAVSQPKAREIHAAAFSDRVVHHWLVPRLEAFYEPIFIHDVYSNRKGKGTHAAVNRLQGFMQSLASSYRNADIASRVPVIASAAKQSREKSTIDRILPQSLALLRNDEGDVIASETKQSQYGYYLQLDIKNFFNSIDRSILFTLIQQRLRKSIRTRRIDAEQASFVRDIVHRILKQDIGKTSIEVGDKALLQRIPAYKRLANAGLDKGLPIGNLTSQFFANVYLNELDQFVKHSLKCHHYLRYVDDFILLHHDPQQLRDWQQKIERFLASSLQLELRAPTILKPCNSGADFLGYIIKPEYRLVRRRVIGNLKEKLNAFGRELLRDSRGGHQVLCLPVDKRRQLQSVLASYFGHFRHAHCYTLIAAIFRQYAWLDMLFSVRGRHLTPRWEPVSVSGYRSQVAWFRRQYPMARMMIQRGMKMDVFTPARLPQSLPLPSNDSDPSNLSARGHAGVRSQVKQIIVREQGYLRGGLKRRVLEKLFIDPREDCATPVFNQPNQRRTP